jgi:hypothetical protein
VQKLIDGKRYDTEKAECIGEYDNIGEGADSKSDFKWWEAGLYVTRSGNYFLAGEGGPMSLFARPAGGSSRSGGSDIRPMEKEEAFQWAQRHLKVTTVEAHFGDMIEDA